MRKKPILDNSVTPHLHLDAECHSGELPVAVYPGVHFSPEYWEVEIVSDGRHPLQGELGDCWQFYIIQSMDDVHRQGVDEKGVGIIPLCNRDRFVSVSLDERSDFVLDEVEPQYGVWLLVGFCNPDFDEVLQFPYLLVPYPEGGGQVRLN